jgi:hypothetical protein
VYRVLRSALMPLVLSACAHQVAPRFNPSADLLTREQLAGTHATSVYDAVRQLRPSFLRARGPTSLVIPGTEGPALWVDEAYIGDVAGLRDIPLGDVVSIRYLSSWDAATRYGSKFLQGVLVVTTRP